jgi:hypothetical protein
MGRTESVRTCVNVWMPIRTRRSQAEREYTGAVEKTARIFRSFEEAERAEREYYAGLTPQERIEIVNELHAKRHPDADQQRLQRVYRVTTLGKC